MTTATRGDGFFTKITITMINRPREKNSCTGSGGVQVGRSDTKHYVDSADVPRSAAFRCRQNVDVSSEKETRTAKTNDRVERRSSGLVKPLYYPSAFVRLARTECYYFVTSRVVLHWARTAAVVNTRVVIMFFKRNYNVLRILCD